MCGLFGVRAPGRDVARVTYFGLFALQHRGQESAGIAVSDEGRVTALRDMGLVTQVFDEQKLRGLRGELAIGHTRYSTTGSSQWWNAQPLVQHGSARTIALGHNGNLTNAGELRDELAERGHKLATTADTEVIAALIAADPAPLDEAVANTMRKLDGAFSVVALSEGKLIAFRDPRGMRPLCLGRLDQDWVVASETCALDLVGAEFEREVRPGELLDHRRARHSPPGHAAGRRRRALHLRVLLSGAARLEAQRRRGARRPRAHGRAARAGVARRGRSRPADSGFRHPRGDRLLARAQHPVQRGLIKNRYVGRTFIQPDQGLREQGIRLKFNPLAEVAGKRVVAVDDSIVRGNTTRQIVQMLFDAGAAEVHVRISSPPVISQCYYGIDFADPDELIAAKKTRRGSARAHRGHVAGVHLARGPAGIDAAAGVAVLPRLSHAGLPDGNPARSGEASIRSRLGSRS